MGSKYPIGPYQVRCRWPTYARAITGVTALLLATACASLTGRSLDANAQLSRIYLEAVAHLQYVENKGADAAVMERLDTLKQELADLDIGNDPCLARKQDQVAQTIKVVSLATAAFALQGRGIMARRADDFARTMITRSSDPDNQPRSADSCYGKGLPEVNIGGQSI